MTLLVMHCMGLSSKSTQVSVLRSTLKRASMKHMTARQTSVGASMLGLSRWGGAGGDASDDEGPSVQV